MSDALDRFTGLLKAVFELDKSDLDFGIYRVMNLRKAEIEHFLTVDLPRHVTEALAPFAGNKENAAGGGLSAPETEVYSRLSAFLSRYYDEGGFISKRRSTEGVYAIPREGEDVTLSWVNQDQYYIKTSDNFKDYRFSAHGTAVHFMLAAAAPERHNNKDRNDKKRAFMLYTEHADRPGIKTFEVNGNEFIIRFRYDVSDGSQKSWNEKNYEAIASYIAAARQSWLPMITPPERTKTNPAPKSLLRKHLEAYAAGNTVDYFIHKDLGAFLRRELDFYIKNEMIHLDDIDRADAGQGAAYLAAAQAVRRLGRIIIDVLARIENFQKKLWLKKKFILRTDWCITLDRVDEAFYEEIRNNKAQVREWMDRYGIDREELGLSENGADPPPVQFLKENKRLLIDTGHFPQGFKEALIAGIDRLDDVTDGVLIHGENSDALSLLHGTGGSVQCICIDPPYNTGNDGFLYKDNYQSSSWLSMMNDRIQAGWELLHDSGVMFIFSGDEEYEHLAALVRSLFTKHNFFATLVWEKKKKGSFLSGTISKMKDYIICVSKNIDHFSGLTGEIAEDEETYPCVNPSNPRERRTIPKGIKSRYREKDALIKSGTAISSGNMTLLLHSDLIIKDGMVIEDYEIEGNWRYSQDRIAEYAQKGELYVTQDLYLRRIVKEPRRKIMKDLLLRLGENGNDDYKAMDVKNLNKYGWGTNEDANDELLRLFGTQYLISYPKPSKLITLLLCSLQKKDGIYLDYFAGSATTGHAVINLNRQDGGSRKYVLVEMGEYFKTLTKPRMQKAIYAKDWKNGRPAARNTGVSHIMKYFRLESYEDALTNIARSDETPDRVTFGGGQLLNYMPDTEAKGSLLTIDTFKTPFDYTLKIAGHKGIQETPVDLPETFNYLLGLHVIRQGAVRYFKAAPAAAPEYENALDLEPDRESGEYGFQQIEGRLRDGRRALVIWRTITEDLLASNAALDAYFLKSRVNPRDREFDVVYVNGGNNLEKLRRGAEPWKVRVIENVFLDRMFEA